MTKVPGLLMMLLFTPLAFGMTSEQETAVDVLNSLTVETVETVETSEIEGEDLPSRINGSVTVLDYYDRVNEVFKYNVKNKTDSKLVEVGVVECSFSYKTRLGEDAEENRTQTFTGKIGGTTAQARGTKKLCTRGFACGFIMKVIGCDEDQCQRYFGPNSLNLANEGDQYDDFCMLEATTSIIPPR